MLLVVLSFFLGIKRKLLPGMHVPSGVRPRFMILFTFFYKLSDPFFPILVQQTPHPYKIIC